MTLLITYNVSVTRNNEDKFCNNYGIRLIRFCKVFDLVICNDRVREDKNVEKLTYCDKKGKSCIDYALISKGLSKYVKDFKVDNFNAFFLITYLYLSPLNVNIFSVSNITLAASPRRRGVTVASRLWLAYF